MRTNKIIVVMGQSGSGKSAVTKRLCKDEMFNKVRTVTSRPRRYREGKDDYEFTSNLDFVRSQNKGEMIGVRTYNTLITGESEIFRYGVSTALLKQSMRKSKHSVIISDLDGFFDIADTFGRENVIGFYLDVPFKTLVARASKRKDFNQVEHERRYNTDIKAMSHDLIDRVSRLYCIYVIDGTQTIDEVTNNIRDLTLERIESIKTD